jgi:uncharacterized protein YjlB
MPLLESTKRIAERVTGWKRPAKPALAALIRERKPRVLCFKDDGVIPNNPKWPLVLYRTPIELPDDYDPAAVIEDVFAKNGWEDSWRDGIYDYVHYHPGIHEVVGIARGRVRVQFGGNKGRTLGLKAGDVAILPAGTGHRPVWATEDLLVVGAYPPSGRYDEYGESLAEHTEGLEGRSEGAEAAQGPGLWEGRPAARAVALTRAPRPLSRAQAHYVVRGRSRSLK